MSSIFNNSSFWPNGVKVVNGHGRFYKLGTNKVKVPTTCWPKGNKFVSPFVYDEDNNLVDFVDTKAMTSNGDAIYLPYELIEADFPNISQGKLQIHAPKATVKKASWKGNNERIDIPEAQFKYKGCKSVENIKTVDSSYQTTDIVNGIWSEPLWDLGAGGNGKQGGGMFHSCSQLTKFSSDLPSLTDGCSMFYECTALTSFSSDLSSLTYGEHMFLHCSNLTSFKSDLPSLTTGDDMFNSCSKLTSFDSDLSSLTNGNAMFNFCSNLTSFSSDLSSLTNGNAMFSSCYNLTSFKSDLPSLTNGNRMFYYCAKIESFSSDLSSLTDGSGMFHDCDELTSFSSDLPSLTDGGEMFSSCSKLTSFSSNLPSLTNGDWMFYNTKLTSFSSNLPSLTNGNNMFCSTNLTSFSAELPSLTDGSQMFQSCLNLTSFNSDLSSLTNGLSMFWYCPNLTSFNSDLSSLTDGDGMFYGCKLDTPSVQNIADTINTVMAGVIDIGIANSEPNEQEKAAFDTIASKNWIVYVNGSAYTPTSPAAITTLDENGEEITTPIPFWAKPVPSDEQNAKYIDNEGNFYNILGAQFIYGDNLESYGMFTCEEDAAANMLLTPYTKPKTEIEKQ